MNIREFAAVCGVAPSTVSNALNLPFEKSRTSRATYDRIRAKAAEVGFRVNYYAQALHSKRSNCLGFIAAGQMFILTERLLFGMSRVLNLQRKNLAVYPCYDTVKSEAEAFGKMVSYETDAVFYSPINQNFRRYSTGHIRRILEKHPNYPPVISIYGGTDIPEFYQVVFRSYDTGKRAALRQLGRGCRKFGVILPLYSNFMNGEMARGYRETLLENGVAPCDIRELALTPKAAPDAEYMRLEGVDGIWCSHYLALLLCATPLFSRIGGSEKIHVDCTCSIESELLYSGLQPVLQREHAHDRFPNWFASMTIYKYRVESLGARAAEVAIQLSGPAAAEVPKMNYIELDPVSFEGGK